jgi:hypothetical protein
MPDFFSLLGLWMTAGLATGWAVAHFRRPQSR